MLTTHVPTILILLLSILTLTLLHAQVTQVSDIVWQQCYGGQMMIILLTLLLLRTMGLLLPRLASEMRLGRTYSSEVSDV